MTFARQRRALLGVLTLVTPWPLAFNLTVEWWWVIGFAVAVGIALARNFARPDGGVLPAWSANVLGLAYLAFLWIDFVALNRDQLVRLMAHALLFALAVRMFRIERERDAWSTLLGVFILFLAAMGTSTHPTIVLFLFAWLSLATLTLARFATFHMFVEFGVRDSARPPLGLQGLALGMTLSAILLAIPLWILLPRIATPMVAISGASGSLSVPLAMLTEEVTLDAIGAIRGNRAVALRATFDPPPGEREELRFKAGTFDRFHDGRWLPSPLAESRLVGWERRATFATQPTVRTVKIWRSDIGYSVLPVPPRTARIQVVSQNLRISTGGSLALDRGRTAALEYTVEEIADLVPLARRPTEEDLAVLASLPDGAGLSAEARELGRREMGEGSTRERIDRLETHLATKYEYTLDRIGRGGARPLDDFLLRDRRGHCEYFASSMVLLLRSQGIPARLVSGFLGAEYNPLGGQYLVRQNNAHAWVEAWIEGEGWISFDPTPTEGQPSVVRGRAGLDFLSQAWEEMVYRWDRHVLGYGYDEQRDAMFGWFQRFLSWRERARAQRAAEAAAAVEAPGDLVTATPGAGERNPFILWGVPTVALLLALAAFLWRRRTHRDAGWAYLETRRALAAAGLQFPAHLPPQALRDLAESRFPNVATVLGRLVSEYLDESFGGRPSGRVWAEDVKELREGLQRPEP